VQHSSKSTGSGSSHIDLQQLSEINSVGGAHLNSLKKLTIDQGHSGSISTASADPREVAIQKFGAPYLETFFNDLGGKLIYTVID
jgi:hypothetical protein